MGLDPYAQCPCGTGKKVKWCFAKVDQEVERLVNHVRGRQEDQALRDVEKLACDNDGRPECVHMYASCLHSQVEASFEKIDPAIEIADQTIATYPEYGLPYETRAEIFLSGDVFDEALDGFRDALGHYPPEATDHLLRCHLKIGTCHNFQGRPLAAWASWQQALKIQPDNEGALEFIEKFIRSNNLLPKAARTGLMLRSPDELSVFNEERREKWDAALKLDRDANLDELATTYAFLAEDDKFDRAAWYNLALVRAWLGRNLEAIEALDHYASLETDRELAADAWHLGEILRVGAGAEEVSDNIHHVVTYRVPEPEAFFELLQKVKCTVVVKSPEGHHSLHWMDREVDQEPSDVPLVGGPPKQLAQVFIIPGEVHIVATTESNLRRVRDQFEEALFDTVHYAEELTRPGSLQTLDAEPFLIFHETSSSPEEQRKRAFESVKHYFEVDWIHRPLKALGGLSPIDAAASEKLHAKLEGVIRFRERNYERYEVGYSFDRLRNKLGLPSDITLDEENPEDVSALSAKQLADLVPAELSDEDLQGAYRTANSLDSPQMALIFAEEMVARESLAAKAETVPLFRRLITDRLERSRPDEAAAFALRGQEADEEHHGGNNKVDFLALRARIAVANDNEKEASELLKQVVDAEPDNFDRLSSEIEHLLSRGANQAAHDLAELGIEKADASGRKDFKEQFREYLSAASSALS
ncbi:hypothetical protein Pan216_44460 [Planctomycetes bacterium Pan216]|uniref:Tetratricopeptide repeat protein n=1 Tax=Kolteria novifilia TaxID=2527975 RepID=A0A518B9B2_9BACT|nr:hypothetical protein Pan216_44460 [Planctomycetes bacterium Pan216]